MEILQEIINIIYGMVDYLPETWISIGIGIGLLLLTLFKGRVGILLASVLLTILAGASFFSGGDFYQVSSERAIAGVLLGFFAVLVNLYLLVRTFADWTD